MSLPPFARRRRFWLIAVPVAVFVAVVVGPWLYINVIREDPPARLSFDDVTTTTAGVTNTTNAGAASGIEGRWTLRGDSQAGYRVNEVLFGQDAEAVGRTAEVTGTLDVTGTMVTAAEVSVDMASLTSPESRRDGQFRGRIMDVSTYPTATFSLGEPIDLGTMPTQGEERTFEATGELTLRGVTRSVTFELAARLEDGSIQVRGSIRVDFDDFEIPDASGGPAKVGRNGELELLLVFTR